MQASRRIALGVVLALVLIGLLPAGASAYVPVANNLNGVACVNSADLAVVVGQGGTVLRTTNGGTTWEAVGPPQYRDYYDVGFSPDGARGWAIGDRGTVFCSNDAGETWVGQTSYTFQPLRALAVVSSSVAYVAGGPQPGSTSTALGVFARTTDGGDTWVAPPLTDPAWTGATPLNEYTFTAVAASGTDVWLRGEHAGSQVVAVSHDSGSTWNAFAGAATVGDLELTGPGVSSGFAVGGSSVLHTTDSWQTVADPRYTATGPLFGLDMLSATNGWAVGDSGGIIHTTDGGTWAAQTSGTVNNLKGVSALSTSVAWAAGENGTLLRTTDAGANWSPIAGPLDTSRPRCYATAKAACYRNKYVSLKYKVNDAQSAIVQVRIKVKTLGGRTVKTLGWAQKPTNLAQSWRFKCRLAKAKYRFWVYATDLSGNTQSRIGKNYLTVK